MALIPAFFPDCVVAIGVDGPDNKKKWIASGFLYGQFIKKYEDGKKEYSIYLITNRHVFESKPAVYVRFNPIANEPAREFKLDLINKESKSLWNSYPEDRIDIAAIPINFDLLQKQAMQVNYFRSDEHVANITKLNDIGITEGDFAYVFGFPMELVGEKRNTVIVRNGSIARIRDVLSRDSSEYLVDVFVFPGNSGGPVVSKPEFLAIEGTKSQNASYLIGVIKGCVTYQDIAISLQTKRPRITFEENSGLAIVHPIDYAEDIIKQFNKSE